MIDWMDWLDRFVLIMYVMTDICLCTLFLIILDKVLSIWRKKTKLEYFSLGFTGWLFVLYLAQIIVRVLGQA